MTLFISHSSKDKTLVKMFCELLTDKMRIDENDIYCTSLNNSLKVGQDFILSIRDNLKSQDAVIFLITENYKNSMFCLMEMGAAWAFKDLIIPIVIHPLDYEFLDETPLKTIQAMSLNNADDIMFKFYQNVLCENPNYKRLSSDRESKLKEAINEFVQRINEYTQKTFCYDLSEATLQCVAQNGNPDAIHILTQNNEYTVTCDFSSNQYYPVMSNFLSCYLKFNPYKNWSNTDSNWMFTFEACSEDNSVSELILEFKSGDTINKVFSQSFKLDKNYTKFSVEINKTQISSYNLKQISEICFVLRPHFVPNFKGTFKLRNICGENDKRI